MCCSIISSLCAVVHLSVLLLQGHVQFYNYCLLMQMAGMLRAGTLATKAIRVLEEHDSCTWRDMSNFINAVAQVMI